MPTSPKTRPPSISLMRFLKLLMQCSRSIWFTWFKVGSWKETLPNTLLESFYSVGSHPFLLKQTVVISGKALILMCNPIWLPSLMIRLDQSLSHPTTFTPDRLLLMMSLRSDYLTVKHTPTKSHLPLTVLITPMCHNSLTVLLVTLTLCGLTVPPMEFSSLLQWTSRP